MIKFFILKRPVIVKDLIISFEDAEIEYEKKQPSNVRLNFNLDNIL